MPDLSRSQRSFDLNHLRWSEDTLPDGLVVRLGGELDLATKAELQARLISATQSTAERIQLDFAQVEFIDASCVGVIVRAWNAMRGSNRLLQLTGLHDFPARVFEVCGLTAMMARSDDAPRSGKGDLDER